MLISQLIRYYCTIIFREVKGLEPIPVGSYRGLQMTLTVENFGRDYILTLKGQL